MTARAQDLSGISVLVTDGHYKHTLGLVRHLGERKVAVDLVSRSSRDLACNTRYCRSTIVAPEVDSPGFVETVCRALKNKRYDAVIPVSYKATKALAKHRAVLQPYAWLGVTDYSKIELAANKFCMAEMAHKEGVGVPRTVVPRCLADVRNFIKELSFPVVVKPAHETAGYSVSYFYDESQLIRFYENVLSTQSLAAANIPLIQEFIPGWGCGFFATYQNGVCKRIFMHRRVREYPASGGVSTCAESFFDQELADRGRRILDALRWHGVAMVEFRRDSRDGQYKLIEVNPKFWGSLELALAAGADFPGDLCRMASGRQLEFTSEYQHNLRFHWPISVSGELYHLWSRPRSLVAVGLDCLNPRVKSNIWLSDFKPHGQELRHIWKLLVGRNHGRP